MSALEATSRWWSNPFFKRSRIAGAKMTKRWKKIAGI